MTVIPLPNAEHDSNFSLDSGHVLKYRYPKETARGKTYFFTPPLQGFVYHAYMETEDPEEVRERLTGIMGVAKTRISVPIVSALIRKVATEILALESKFGSERRHWIFVRSPQVPSAEDPARAAAALFRRVTLEKHGDEFVVRCSSLAFKLAHQAFIYTAIKNLTSRGTAMALATWAPELSLMSTNNLHVRRVFRLIEHQRLATSDADETDHWNAVLRLADRMLMTVRQYAPAEEILQGVSEHFLALEPSQSDPAAIPLEESHRYRRGHGVEQVTDLQRTVMDPYLGQQYLAAGTAGHGQPQSAYVDEQQISITGQQPHQANWTPKVTQPSVHIPYPGQQHLPAATAGRIYPQSPFVNAPQPLTSGQPTYPPNQYLGLPQPAAQPEYSYAPNPDPRSSRTTTAPKRQAQHTLDSGSSNSRPSTSGSNSSKDRHSQGHARHGSKTAGLRPEEVDLMSREKQIEIACDYGVEAPKIWDKARDRGTQEEAKNSVLNLMKDMVNSLSGPSSHTSQSQLSGDEEKNLLSSAMYYVMPYVKEYKIRGSPQARASLIDMMGNLVDAHNGIRDKYKAQRSQRFRDQEITDASYDVQNELDPGLLSGPYRPLASGWNEAPGGRPETTQQMVERPREEHGSQAGRTGGKSSGREPSSQEKKSSSSRGTGQERSSKDKTSTSKDKTSTSKDKSGSSKDKPSSSGRKKRHG